MTYYTDIKAPSMTEKALAWAAQQLEQAAVLHARHRIYRESLGEMRALSERELEDLGLSRYMLKDVAMQAALKQMPHKG